MEQEQSLSALFHKVAVSVGSAALGYLQRQALKELFPDIDKGGNGKRKAKEIRASGGDTTNFEKSRYCAQVASGMHDLSRRLAARLDHQEAQAAPSPTGPETGQKGDDLKRELRKLPASTAPSEDQIKGIFDLVGLAHPAPDVKAAWDKVNADIRGHLNAAIEGTCSLTTLMANGTYNEAGKVEGSDLAFMQIQLNRQRDVLGDYLGTFTPPAQQKD